MNNQNDDAFLKSIFGTMPIKKKNTIQKQLPESKEIKKSDKKSFRIETINEPKNSIKKNFKKSLFKIQKTPINKKLKKGKIPIDKKIDFHGLSVLDAESLFCETIVSCYKREMRCILFVTGKGILKNNRESKGHSKLYYGKIRENFFYWIKKEELQKYLLSFEDAPIEYGADGAFFVYLRKKKLNFY